MTRKLAAFPLAIAAMVSVASFVCQAQAPSLMTRHVREVTLNGQAQSVGRLPATQVMRIVLVLPLRHQPELENFLQELYDPSSPSYRQFLSVEEFTARFGPSQEDYDAVIHFAEANGLAVAATSRNRLNTDVTAPVASRSWNFNHDADRSVIYSDRHLHHYGEGNLREHDRNHHGLPNRDRNES